MMASSISNNLYNNPYLTEISNITNLPHELAEIAYNFTSLEKRVELLKSLFPKNEAFDLQKFEKYKGLWKELFSSSQELIINWNSYWDSTEACTGFGKFIEQQDNFSKELQKVVLSDKELILIAIQHDYGALSCASESLKTKKEVILACAQRWGVFATGLPTQLGELESDPKIKAVFNVKSPWD